MSRSHHKISAYSEARSAKLSEIGSLRDRADRLERAFLDDEWKWLDGIRNELERPIISEMDAIFTEQQHEAIAALNTMRSLDARAFRLSLDALFNAPKWLEATWSRLKGFFASAIFGGYRAGAVQSGMDLPDLTSFDPAVREQLETMALRTRSITETTSSDLAEIIDRALREGWSIDETAREIDIKFDQYTASRSQLIAQTNVTGAFGKGQNEAFSRAGLRKRWLSQRDGRVRITHTAADGQTVDANERFTVGTALLRFPADPETTVLKEIMRCRCSMLPVSRSQ